MSTLLVCLVCLPDSVLAFSSHGVQGRHLKSSEVRLRLLYSYSPVLRFSSFSSTSSSISSLSRFFFAILNSYPFTVRLNGRHYVARGPIVALWDILVGTLVNLNFHLILVRRFVCDSLLSLLDVY